MHITSITRHTECCTYFRNDGSEFGGSYYHKVNDELETGAQLSWTAGSNVTRFGLAAKYTPEKDSTLRVSDKIGLGELFLQIYWSTLRVR